MKIALLGLPSAEFPFATPHELEVKMGDAVRITDGFQSSKARGKAKDDGTGSAVPLVGRRFVVFVLGGDHLDFSPGR